MKSQKHQNVLRLPISIFIAVFVAFYFFGLAKLGLSWELPFFDNHSEIHSEVLESNEVIN